MGVRRFISFEGGEGSGKSTHAARLAERLRAETGAEVVLTREPGGSPDAEKVRELLVTGAAGRWSATAEVLLNYAARDDHLRATIRPALARGAFVVCDRFADSTRAYQGGAGGADPALIGKLEEIVVGSDWPALTLIFDIETEAGLARTAKRAGPDESRFEAKGTAYHETLRQAYLDIAAANPDRCVVVDSSRPVEDVSAVVWEAVASRILR